MNTGKWPEFKSQTCIFVLLTFERERIHLMSKYNNIISFSGKV